MSLILEFVSSVVKNLPEMDEEMTKKWVKDSKGLQKALWDALLSPVVHVKPKPEIVLVEHEWNVWKWVKLGAPNFRDVEDFLTHFKAHYPKLGIGKYTESMLGHADFVVAQNPVMLPLVKITVKELGFNQWTRYDEICIRADKLGLELCSAEVGPQLRRQYLDQPLGDWFVIAMKAIPDSDRDLSLFNVKHNSDGLWLNSVLGRPSDEFSPDNQLVFVPRKYKKPLAT